MFHPQPRRTLPRISFVSLSFLIALLLGAGGIGQATAAPGTNAQASAAPAQNVDWMPAEMARSLDLGFGVLVPTYIPDPFGGLPSVDASGGYYSLYWMASGGSPTFLEISGTVGGSLPAGSPADLNNELFINASVQGYDAIHDLTDIYDAVWWIAGGVLYEVNAHNLSVDSLSLANSLVTLVPPVSEPEPTEPPAEPTATSPAPEETPTQAPAGDATEMPVSAAAETPESTTESPATTPTPEAPSPTVASAVGALSAPATVTAGDTVTVDVEGAEAADLLASAGSFPTNGGTGIVDVQDGAIAWQAPMVESNSTATISLLVSATGEEIDSITIAIVPRPAGEPFRGSDGTDGPPHPVVVGDGTGGPQAVTIPRRAMPTPTA